MKSQVAALRAMLTRDVADAQYARSLVGNRESRGASWISAEIFLEELGVPLDPVPTQWVEPYEDVRDRWLDIGWGTVARAKERIRIR